MRRMKEPPPPARAKRRKPEISAEDHALWVLVARSTKPLPGRALPDLPHEPLLLERAAPQRAPRVELPAPPGARPLPLLSGIEKRMARQVSRGQMALDARIDLHGMRQSEAHAALLGFIHRVYGAGARVVLVITGKGGTFSNGDENARGVLRRLVPLWLADPALRRCVIGFEPAARSHGGEGALYVRIRRNRETA